MSPNGTTVRAGDGFRSHYQLAPTRYHELAIF